MNQGQERLLQYSIWAVSKIVQVRGFNAVKMINCLPAELLKSLLVSSPFKIF